MKNALSSSFCEMQMNEMIAIDGGIGDFISGYGTKAGEDAYEASKTLALRFLDDVSSFAKFSVGGYVGFIKGLLS
mgnify:CR=1 FL=1